MKSFLSFLLMTLVFSSVQAQKTKTYLDSMKAYQKAYVDSHEVVKGKDRKYFRFFPISKDNRVLCRFEKLKDTVGFTMKTSAGTQKHFFRYGKIHFNLNNKACQLFVYRSRDLMQSEKYHDYLFIPFMDATTGDESYGSGRYLDIVTGDIVNDQLMLDLNKAYNPYCAYASGFKCPIPPKENTLNVAVRAGEMLFRKLH